VTSRLERGGGLLFVNNEAELEQELSHLLSNEVLRSQIAARAKESADEESGSLARLKDSLFGKLGQLGIN
jgi:3-deoxy-D-manno-octulosonic-acid transferase